MKIRNLTLIIVFSVANYAAAENYILTIDGESYDISLDQKISIKVGDEEVNAKLSQKDIFNYKTENFSFQHPKQYMPSKSDLGDGLFQTVVMTPLGSAVMIQEYLNIAPSNLMDLMINELTKEERGYGYTIKSIPISTTLSDGMVLGGNVVTSKYKDTNIKRVFYSYDIKDSGLFIMTQIDYEIGASDDAFINGFIDSLKITMK